MENKRDYDAKAQNDAWDMANDFLEEIIEQAATGEVSNDYNNDYADGDSYHHENHVDKAYDLLDAAELLDQLSDHEETDYGLWQGQHDPREAISVQAAYTYGNAVGYHWNNIIKEINEFLDKWEWDSEDDRKDNSEKFIKVFVWLNARLEPKDCEGMVAACLKDIANLEWTSTLALCDWLDEHELQSDLVKNLRILLA